LLIYLLFGIDKSNGYY